MRGYDAMQRVAQEFAGLRGYKQQRLLRRTQDIAQRGASRKDRLRQQFAALTAVDTEITSPILLLEDIYTTGGTCRAALSKLGVYQQPLYVGIVARQPLE